MNTDSRSSIPPIPVLLLFGPTGVGKTELVLELFPDHAEVINADSAQVYRGMDIGTAKPPRSLRERLPHHLIDIRDPNEGFSVGEFVSLADRAVAEVAARGALPVLSGGTAFYLRNFLYGLPTTPPSDAAVRKRLQEEAEERGFASLHAELAAVDPPSASRLPEGDRHRILRALEVFRLTGRPLSSFELSETPRGGYRFLTIGLDRPREELYGRIDARVDAMFALGLEAEVDALLGAGYGFDDPGMKAIGYREFEELRAGRATRDAVRALIKRDSRRYAKRQLTFFRRLPGVRWFHPGDGDALRRELAAFASRSG